MKIDSENQRLLQKDITLLERKLKHKGLLKMINLIIPAIKPQALRDDFRYTPILGYGQPHDYFLGLFAPFLQEVALIITVRKAILRSEGEPDKVYVSFQWIYHYEYPFGKGEGGKTVQFDFIDGKEVTPDPFPSDPNPQNLSLWS